MWSLIVLRAGPQILPEYGVGCRVTPKIELEYLPNGICHGFIVDKNRRKFVVRSWVDGERSKWLLEHTAKELWTSTLTEWT